MNHLFQRYLDTFRGLSRDIWILAAVMLINRAGAMVLPFLTIYLTDAKGYTLAQAGLLMSCFGVGSLVGNYAGGWLADQWKYIRVQILSLWLTGGMWMLLSMADTFWQFGIGIFLTSLSGSMFRPANMAAIELHGDPQNRTRALSLNRLAINLGFSMGPAAAGFFIASMGYQSLFFADGISCWLASLVLIFFLKPKEAADQNLNQEGQPATPTPAAVSPWKDKKFLVFVLSQLFVVMTFMQVFSTVPVYWKEVLSLNESYIGMLMAFNGILIVITEMPLIHVLEHKRNPVYWVQFGAILIIGGAVFLAMGEWVLFSWLYMVMITFGEILNFPFANSYVLSIANPVYRGRYMGIFSMTWSLAFIIAPSVGGFIVEHWGYTWLAIWMALMGTVGVAGLYLSTRMAARKAARQLSVPA